MARTLRIPALLIAAPLLGVLLSSPPALAQEASGADETTTSETAAPGPVLTDPETGERYVVVRPDDELARGRWTTERWVPFAVGAGVVVLAFVALGRRIARSRS